MIRELGREPDIPMHQHLLRQTFIIGFLSNAANVLELQASLGHSTLEMSRRYCQALSFEDAQRRHRQASPVDKTFIRKHTSVYARLWCDICSTEIYEGGNSRGQIEIPQGIFVLAKFNDSLRLYGAIVCSNL